MDILERYNRELDGYRFTLTDKSSDTVFKFNGITKNKIHAIISWTINNMIYI